MRIKTAWVSEFGSYESELIEKLNKKCFKINLMEDAAKAVHEVEAVKYELIVVSSELYADENIDEDFRWALRNCKKEGANYDIDCSKVSLYFIDRIKKGKKSEINQYTPLVVNDYFCRFSKDPEKERFIIAGANNIINGRMSLDNIISRLKYF
jgi:hypothetical protein